MVNVICDCIDRGANAYVPKSDMSERRITTIENGHSNAFYFNGHATAALGRSFRQIQKKHSELYESDIDINTSL